MSDTAKCGPCNKKEWGPRIYHKPLAQWLHQSMNDANQYQECGDQSAPSAPPAAPTEARQAAEEWLRNLLQQVGIRHLTYATFEDRTGRVWSIPEILEAYAHARCAEAETGWRHMESAPRNGREILIEVQSRAGIPGKCLVGHYMPGGHCIEDHPPIDEGWYFFNGCMFDQASKPLRWMPIPLTQSRAEQRCAELEQQIVNLNSDIDNLTMKVLPGIGVRYSTRPPFWRNERAESAEARNAALTEALRTHWLAGVDCHHARGTDQSSCACSRFVCPPQQSVGEAVERWIEHIKAEAEALLAAAAPQTTTEKEGK